MRVEDVVEQIGGALVARRVQPGVPGRWLEITTLVPGSLITGSQTRVRIVAEQAGAVTTAYLPYYHWAFQGNYSAPASPGTPPVAFFGERGTIRLRQITLEYAPARADTPGSVTVRATWEGPAEDAGDGVVFVHLYNTNNLDAEPVAQVVTRPGDGALPPANWLPGPFEDRYEVSLPKDLSPGEYVVALGMFEARTGERYPVTGEGAGSDRRLFIGTITVEETAE